MQYGSSLRLVFSILILLFLIGCQRQPNPSTPLPTAQASANESVAPAVSTAAAIERTVARSIEITGTLEGQEEITISSEIEGRIAQVHFDFGSFVKAGDKLVDLDKREFEWKVSQAEAAVRSAEGRVGAIGRPPVPLNEHTDVRQARAALEQAKLEFDRAEKLLKNGDISRSIYDQKKADYDQADARHDSAMAQVYIYHANLDQAKALLELARKQLADAAVYAPITGAVEERLASKGEYLTKGRNIARIIQLDPLRLRADVPEQYIGKLRVGQSVVFRVESMPDTEFHGTLTRMSPAVDKKSRSLTVEASVKNAGLKLRPGMFARAGISVDLHSNAVFIPQSAVTTTAGMSKIYLAENGQARSRIVKLGQTDGNLVEILEGVKSGDLVITDNLDKLQDGSPVKNL